MKRMQLRLIALCLAAALLLTGCNFQSVLEQVRNQMQDGTTEPNISDEITYEPVAFDKMTYTRPDMDALEKALTTACDAAESKKSVSEILDAVYDFYYAYDAFYTNMYLAYIHYNLDLTDDYWEDAYAFCAENAATVDAALDDLYYTLAACSQREKLEDKYFGKGFFDSYRETESVWDDELMELMEAEAALLDRYYDLSEQTIQDPYAQYDALAQLLVELIALRQEIAAAVGYDSYPEFAYDFYYLRDYTPEQAEEYCTAIGQALHATYTQANRSNIWETVLNEHCSEKDTYRYVQKAAQAMGGTIEKAFAHLDTYELYDLGYSKNKFETSFEVYLWTYASPFIYAYTYGDSADKLTFAHEFGHFANDYTCGGSYAGTDVAEVHSQAFEYLSLCYGEDTEALTRYKMADSLCVYIEEAAYTLFEQQAYRLTGEDLTAENVAKLFEEICLSFGFDSWDWDPRSFVSVPHFYNEPMYMISYVVSNDLALQFYQLEQAKKGHGLKLYMRCLKSQDTYITDFIDAYGLEDPFAKGRPEELAVFFSSILQED